MLENAYPYLLPSIVPIPEAIEKGLRQMLEQKRQECDITLSNGPYGKDSTLALFAHEGRIDKHQDGAGITYGLIIIADGDHSLKTGTRTLPLRAGTFFAINSDEDHETITDDDQLLAFITMDFFHHMNEHRYMSPALRRGLVLEIPHLTPEAFVEKALRSAAQWAEVDEFAQ